MTVEPTRDDEPQIHPARAAELTALAERLGHRFRDLGLLDRALCHSSTGNERRTNYERLEFLGDAVLGFLVAEALYHHEPEIPEGELTDRRARIVSRAPLAAIARDLGLGDALVGGRSLRAQDRGSMRILADLTESVLAAVYLDGGIRAARKFVRRHVLARLDQAVRSRPERDPKSRLLHFSQVRFQDQPSYSLLDTCGPDHARVFEVAVSLGGRTLATGSGRTKQAAEKVAAQRALELLQEETRSDEGDEPRSR